MKSRGIRFEVVNDSDAYLFLQQSNYYFKLKAYAKNYEKYVEGNKKGQYINLDFAYLKDLSTLDMHFRKFIIKSTLDIEHFLRLKLINDINLNPLEDGYQIVSEWLDMNPRILTELHLKRNHICSGLIEKFVNNFAIWNLVEVLSFGDFVNLYQYYYKKYPNRDSMCNLVYPIKCIRNAAAHNNCLLNTLRSPYPLQRRTKELSSFLAGINTIPNALRRRMLLNPIIHDFVCMICVYDVIILSKQTKWYFYNELKELLYSRCKRNHKYYSGNKHIVESYRFICLVVDHFEEKNYND